MEDIKNEVVDTATEVATIATENIIPEVAKMSVGAKIGIASAIGAGLTLITFGAIKVVELIKRKKAEKTNIIDEDGVKYEIVEEDESDSDDTEDE
jgi:hypothetical protein